MTQYAPTHIEITDTATGEMRVYVDDFGFDDDPASGNEFCWSEGNFSCDCNRELFFERANGNEPDETECGDDRFRVLIKTMDGVVLYQEDASSKAPKDQV